MTENLSDRVLAGENLAIIWLTFPFIKILHEMGHGYATRALGGEVHEMGLMLLALMAVPRRCLFRRLPQQMAARLGRCRRHFRAGERRRSARQVPQARRVARL
ncbi:MAG: hypothetical protein ACKN9T_12360 [Candidatus Methylumidiphilus sp.]